MFKGLNFKMLRSFQTQKLMLKIESLLNTKYTSKSLSQKILSKRRYMLMRLDLEKTGNINEGMSIFPITRI